MRASGQVAATYSVAAYLYGLEHAGDAGSRLGCNYVAVAVEGSIESPPFVACVQTKAGGTAQLRRLGAAFDPAFEIMESGTWGAHVWDRASAPVTVSKSWIK